MSRPRRRMLLYLALAVALAAAALFVAVWRYQASGVYAFDTTIADPDELGVPGLRCVRFRSEDGYEASAWLVPGRPDRAFLLSFFGGFSSIGPSFERMRPLLEDGFGVAMLVYRSSSGTVGKPSEANFAMDARALYDQLDALLGSAVPIERRVLHGVSLGSSVAAGLARDRAAGALVLESTFDRCCRWHSRRMFRLPMCLLMWCERHDVADKLRGVRVPVLQLHGERDQAVPIAWGRALFETLSEPRRFRSYPQAGHMDLLEHGAARDIAAFLAPK